MLSRRWLALSLLATSACGGGGGGGSSVSAPQNLAYASDTAVLLFGAPAAPNVPTVEGSVELYTVSPALPAGLALDPASGAIGGTPSEAAPRRAYVVRASNSAGSTDAVLEIAVARPQRYAYATSREDGMISTFVADLGSGRLVRKGLLAPAPGESGPQRIAVDPTQRFLYVPNLGTSNVSAYAVDATSGDLTRLAPVATGAGPHALALSPSGERAYVACQGSDELRAYAVQVDGSLAPVGAPGAVGQRPSALAVSPDGALLFVALEGAEADGAGGGVQAFALDPVTGLPTAAGAAFALGGARPAGLAVDELRANLYVTLRASDQVLALAYDRASGALSAPSADAAGDAPGALALSPDGRLAWVASEAGGRVDAYAVDPASGALAPLGPAAEAEAPRDVEIDPTGRYAYVVEHGARAIASYAVDPATGALSLIERAAVRGTPGDLAIVRGDAPAGWKPRVVHVANTGSNDLSSFRIDASDGALMAAGSPLLSGLAPVSVAIDPRGRFVAVLNRDSASLAKIALDPATGEPLEGGSPVALSGSPRHVAIEPAGRFLYVVARDVAAAGDGWLSTFAISASGSLSPLDAREVGANAVSVAVEPAGEYLYVVGEGDGTPGTASIEPFRIDAASGIPGASAPAAVLPGAYGIGFHPSGFDAYGVLRSADITVQYRIDRASGGLTFLPGGVRAGFEPSAIALTPDGRHAYVAYADLAAAGHVGMYAVDPATHRLLPPAELFLDGTHPADLAIDPSGRFLYVANAGSDTVSVMTIGAGGELAIGTPLSAGVAPAAVAVSGVTQ